MYNGKKVIDVHGHISSPPAVRAYAFNLTLVGDTASKLVLTDEQVTPAMDRHLRMLDERNIDIQLISARPIAMMHNQNSRLVDHWSRTTNDLIAQQVRLRPDRFLGVAQLPQNVAKDTSNCLAELERTSEMGFVAATVNPDPGADRQAPGMNDPYWFPLYKRAEELEMTLIVHPSITTDPRTEILTSAYQYNNLTEETLATLLLENSDVFERFPKLKILVCHCGGSLRRLAYKCDPVDAVAHARGADNAYRDSGEIAGGQVGMPVQAGEKVKRDLSQNLFFDTCAYDPHFLSGAIKQRGVAQMAFGTEVPGSGSDLLNPEIGRPVDDVLAMLESFDFLNDAERLDIVHNNPLRMFPRLKGASLGL